MKAVIKYMFALFIALNLLSIMIITNSIVLINDKQVYLKQFDKLEVHGNFDDPELPFEIVDLLMEFFSSDVDAIDYFTEEEMQHLHDVRLLLSNLRVVVCVNLFLILICFYFFVTKKRFDTIALGFIFVLPLTLLMILFMINFDNSFILFHRLFFPQGNWQFPVDSTLIKLFPQDFFLNMTKMIIF